MRSLDAARESWQDLKNYHTLRELKDAVKLDGASSAGAGQYGLRSACWKAFLLFDNVDLPSWPKTLSSSRSAYNSFCLHFLAHLDTTQDLSDPLSDDADSMWNALQADRELRAEILQDVERCMPENQYFRQPDTQRLMLDILFIFCKLNPDVGYRQGMHELLAPILWVVERDAIQLGGESKMLGEDKIVEAVFDAEHVEHDAFAVFAQVMQNAKRFYEQTTHEGRQNPIVLRSGRVMTELLPQVDAELAQHLQRIDIVPQVFLIRWLRLLFGREFSFDDLLPLWDVLFAEDPSLEIVDYICIAMLLRIRWELLDSDYNSALTILLRYPTLTPPDDIDPADGRITSRTIPAQTLALDALYLRSNTTAQAGTYLVQKYTSKPIGSSKLQPARPTTPPAMQRNITTFSGQANAAAKAFLQQGRSAALSPPRMQVPRQVSNMEALLQSRARDLYVRGGKAVKSAVDEVHKRAQEIRDTQVPTPPPSFYRHRAARSGSASGTLLGKIHALETRNAQIAKLLEGAIGELWEVQGKLAEACEQREGRGQEGDGSANVPDESTQKQDVEKLSVAIAKAQFVQVYLDDASLPLPMDGDGDAESVEKQDADVLWSATEQHVQGPDHSPSPVRPVEAKNYPLMGARNDVGGNAGTLADPSTFDDFNDDDPFELEEPAPLVPPKRRESLATASLASHLKNGASETASAKSKSISNSKSKSPEPPTAARPSLTDGNYSFMLGQAKEDVTESEKTATPPPATAAAPVRNPQQRKARGFLFGDADEGAEDGNDDDDTVVVVAKRRGSGSRHKKKVSKGEKVEFGGN